MGLLFDLPQDGLVRRLLHWAEFCDDPLRSYATGLLAGAMELQDVADKFKEANATMVRVDFIIQTVTFTLEKRDQ